MNKFRTWALAVVGFLIIFVGLNAVIWKLFTEELLTFKTYYNGGLDRAGYIVGSKHYRKPEFTLTRRHIENYEYAGQHIDVLTIGDSFSNDKDNGRDPLYQDWIASTFNLTVMNIQYVPGAGSNELLTIAALLNSGYLDKVKPRSIIVQTVERRCIPLYFKKLDLGITLPLPEVEAYYRTAAYISNPPETGFINTGNFKFILYNVLYAFSDHAFISDVYVRELDRPFFSVRNDKRLLFYHHDVEYAPLATEQNVERLNDNFNAMADLLRKKGITLYFMPAADKYNMYSDHIVNNPYPKSRFFETLRTLPRQYVLVDTKAMLSEEIEKDVKDVYYADDTHWSWKASKKIAESMKF
jgi:hypothetical protein